MVYECRRSVHIQLGDYQTLLRPMRRVQEADEENCSEEVDVCDTPASYGDDTLRAIAVITEKYDSFRRRQMRVRSFLAARLSHSLSRDSTSASDDGTITADSCPRRETSIASTRYATARPTRISRPNSEVLKIVNIVSVKIF